MSAFHLQARRAVGDSGPRREQTRLAEADSIDAADRIADELAVDGYTVWIFQRSAYRGVGAATHALHLLRTIRPSPPTSPSNPARKGVAAARGRT